MIFLQLSIANILLVTITYPLFVRETLSCINLKTRIGDSKGMIPAILPHSEIFCGTCMIALMLLAIIRYRQIVHSTCVRTVKHRAQHVLVGFWSGLLAMILIPKIFKGSLTLFDNALFQVISPFIFSYVCPLIVICYTYIQTKLFSSKHMAMEWRKGSGHTALVTNIVLRHKRSMHMLMPMSVSSIILIFPLHVTAFASFFAKSYLVEYQLLSAVFVMFFIVLNVFLLPLFHYTFSLQVRASLKKSFKWAKKNFLCYPVKGQKTPKEILDCEQSLNTPPEIHMPHLKLVKSEDYNSYNENAKDFVISGNEFEEMIKLISQEFSEMKESVL